MFENPKQVLEAWLSGVNSGNLDGVLGLYHKKAVLLPTFSNKSLANSTAIKDYFEKLARRKGLHVQLHEQTLVVQGLSAELHSMSGIYTWQFEVDGESLNFEARFTYTVNVTLDRPIVHHHSSQVPQTI